MNAHEYGAGTGITGAVSGGEAGRMTMKPVFGGRRIADMLADKQLLRIC